MPTIPGPKEQSVLPEGQLGYQSAGGASPDAFGASIGQASQQAGQSADNVAMRDFQLKNEADHVNALNDLMSQAQDLQNGNKDKGITGYRTLVGQNAVDALPDYQEKLNDAYKNIRAGLNPAVQREFDQTAFRVVRGTTDSMGSYSAQQQVVGLHQSTRAQVGLAQTGALTYADDPDGFAAHLSAVQEASLSGSRILGLGPDATEMQRQRDVSTVYEDRTKQLTNRNPLEAAQFYHDNIGSIVPDKRYELEKMLKGTTDNQYAHGDGEDAYKSAIGTPSSSPTPKDFSANFVKPIDDKHLASVTNYVKAPSQYDPAINQASQLFGVSPTEIKLKIAMESMGDPKAVSPAGAVGIGQFTPATAKRYGVTDPTDPVQSINGIAKMLAATGGGVGGDPSKADRTYYGGNDNATGRNTDQYVENTRVARQALAGGSAPAPLTTASLEGKEQDVITAARAQAEQRRPGDAAYADQVVAHAHSHWAMDVQALRNQDYQNFTSVLGAAQQTNALTPSDLPMDVQQTLSKLPPQNVAGINAQFERNLRAQNGEFTHSDPRLVQDLTKRIYSDGDDKITNPGQLSEFMGKGLNYSDQQRLIKEIGTANTPEGSPFLKQTNQVKETARKMLTTSMSALAIAHPEMAEEASYRFGLDVDNKIKAARAAKVDPQTLFTPGNPNYVLDPSRVNSFMPTESQIAARKAAAAVPTSGPNPTTPASTAGAAPRAATQTAAPTRIGSDADYNALQPGSLFIAPDGTRRRKPGGPT